MAYPASEGLVQTVDENLSKHDFEIKGEPVVDNAWDIHEASLIKIKKTLDELKAKEVEVKPSPKSIAQHLESK